jgi:hypothetical protein
MAIKVGELLLQKKQSLKHGEWLPWCKRNLPFTERTAQRYILAWKNREVAKEAYENEHLSMRGLLAMSESKSYKPGTIQADKKRMMRDIVQPVRVVKNRLKHLPWLPSSDEALSEVIAELQVAIVDLVSELQQ